jgi:hypothetical protein
MSSIRLRRRGRPRFRTKVSQAGAAMTQRPPGPVAAVLVQQVERHEERRRGDDVVVGLAQRADVLAARVDSDDCPPWRGLVRSPVADRVREAVPGRI